jgi:hypothetical protein
MRWIVEVSSLESTGDAQSFCVEAESWQGALQSARRLRGDDSRMAGFSIDITNDGCNAVDPAARRRYVVKRTADDTPLTPGGDAPPPSRRSKPPSSKKKATPEPPATQKKLPDQTMPMAAVSADIAIPPSEKKVPAPAPSAPASSAKPPKPAPSKPAKPKASEPPVPPTVITREQNPTAEVPLTYREYGFVVPSGTTEDAAAQILLVQYARIKRTLESAPAGKLVNLAAFDVMFEGSPPVKPVATLTWKDWRGEPTTSFPRRKKKSSAPPAAAGAAPVVIPQAPPVPAIAAPVAAAAAPVAAAPAPVAAAPAPVAAAPAPVAVAPAPAPVAVAPVVAVAPAAAPAAKAPSQPPPAPAAKAPSQPPPAPAAKAPSQPPPAPAAKAPSQPPPAAPVASQPPTQIVSQPPVSGRRRVRGDELISVLFEAMHDLHFQVDAVAGADFALRLALEYLPSRYGMVYFYDIDKREFVVVAVRGLQAPSPSVLLRRTPETEPAFALATRRRQALLLSGAELEAHAPCVGSAKSVVLAPVMDVGRYLGAIELVDPEDGHAFTDLDANAVSYMAQQLAEFASARGIIVDPERVAQTAAQVRAR